MESWELSPTFLAVVDPKNGVVVDPKNGAVVGPKNGVAVDSKNGTVVDPTSFITTTAQSLFAVQQ